ncbi:MAG TPA: hypothetical protein PKE69_09135 [Pyrinomonadaceae bacterium]|nr:hypothetical protein [Pyrinomonadaceae bacterium]
MADNTYSTILEQLGFMTAYIDTLDAAKLSLPADLIPAELTILRTAATGLHTEVGNKKGDWRTVTLDRTTDADKLSSMAAQAVALLQVQGASDEQIKDARFYVRKLQGRRATPAVVDDPATPDIDESEASISASQQSNAAKISHFNELIDFLEAQPEYASVNNTGFKINELRAFADSVQAKHQASIVAVVQLSTARVERDKVFFNNTDSILNRAKRIKKAVGAAYGFNSPEFQTVNAFKIQRP